MKFVNFGIRIKLLLLAALLSTSSVHCMLKLLPESDANTNKLIEMCPINNRKRKLGQCQRMHTSAPLIQPTPIKLSYDIYMHINSDKIVTIKREKYPKNLEQNLDLEPKITSELSAEFKGKYISSDKDGTVTIKQKEYPKYFDVHSLHLEPKILSEMMIDEGNDMPYQLVDYNDLNGPFEAIDKIEATMSSEPFTIIKSDQIEEKSYSSIGELEIFHYNGKHFYGSAVALDKNLAIAEANNFLPAKFGNKPNTDRIRAEDVRIHDMLTIARSSENTDVRSIGISTHCFIHPEWEKNFNPDYNIALIFLSDSVNLTYEQIHLLQKIRVFSEITEEILHIVSAKKGSNMSKYAGKQIWKQAINSNNITYHLTKTLGENWTISEGSHITRKTGDSIQSKSGIKIRSELLPFIDNSIRLHQEFLSGMNQIKEMTKQTKQQREQELVDKGVTQGIAQEKAKSKEAMVNVAKSLKAMSLPIGQIKSATGLTDDEIRKI